MSSLIQNLRSLARSEHDDLTVADEAADEIERLLAGIERMGIAIDYFSKVAPWSYEGDEHLAAAYEIRRRERKPPELS